MSTLPPKATALQSFGTEDVRNPEKFRAMLNDMVKVIRGTQQVRSITATASSISPTIGAFFTTFQVTLKSPGFVVGGVLLTAMRNMTKPAGFPCPWAVDFLQLQDGSVQINGAVSNAVYAVSPGFYAASFLVIEGS